MANLKAIVTTPIFPKTISKDPLPRSQLSFYTSKVAKNRRRAPFVSKKGVCCATTAGEVGLVREFGDEKGVDGYLVKEFGWGVRRMVEVREEMRRVAEVQAEAFHVPVALFNDAEVLAALIYRIRNSPPDRYACLVAESLDRTDKLVGVADATVQRDEDVLRHLQGSQEFLYVSGIAVLTKFRRRKIGKVLLKACDELSILWGYGYLALRVYEDDFAARKLYSNAGYRVAARDPDWMSTWIGRKRRVLMIKPSPLQKNSQNP